MIQHFQRFNTEDIHTFLSVNSLSLIGIHFKLRFVRDVLDTYSKSREPLDIPFLGNNVTTLKIHIGFFEVSMVSTTGFPLVNYIF